MKGRMIRSLIATLFITACFQAVLFAQTEEELLAKALDQINQGEDAQAFETYDEAVRLYPQSALAYYRRGLAYDFVENFDKALSDYARALEINPDYADVYRSRALLYRVANRFQEAIADYDKLIQLDPNEAKAYSGRATAYAVTGPLEKAIVDCAIALQIDPNCSEAYFLQAIIYAERKDYDLAWSNVHKAQALGEEFPPDFLEKLKNESGREE